MKRRAIVAAVVFLAACGADDSSADTEGSGSSSGSVDSTGPASSTTTASTVGPTSTTVADESSGSDSTGEPVSNQPPTAVAMADPASGVSPWTATLDGTQSTDVDGEVVDYAWSWSGGDASGDVATVELLTTGCTEVSLDVTDDDGAMGTTAVTIATVSSAPPKTAVATLDAAPLIGAVLPRDLESNLGTARFAGTLETDGFGEVRANVLADGVVVDSVSIPVCGPAPQPFELEVPIPAALAAYDVRLVAAVGAVEAPLAEVTDLVAGDIYLINGQSNAYAAQYNGDANVNQTPFIRSFGINSTDPITTQNSIAWYPAAGNGAGGAGGIGQWAIRMANVISQTHDVPVAVINGSLGGQPIGYFERNDDNPADLATNYGRLLHRMQTAGISDRVRAILWYQGESDGTAWDVHQAGFEALLADWAEDYPAPQQIYVTQLRAGCGGDLIRTQEYQRTLPDAIDGISVMSTTALDGHDGCHYAYVEGYEELGTRYAGLLGRDLYGEMPATDVQPPNPMAASLENGGTEIVISLRNPDEPMVFDDGAQADFVVEGAAVTVLGGTATAGELRLMLSGDATGATGITYLGHVLSGPWVTSEAGLGLLTFWNLPLR